MKIALLVENIEENLSLINKTIPSHAPVPILSHILLEARREGFFITATDLEFGVKLNIPAKIEEEGSVAVPGRQFIETISGLPKEKIFIETKEDELIIRSRGNTITMSTIGKEEFPNIYEQKGELILTEEKEKISNIFSSVIFSTSQEESRPELTGVLLRQKEKDFEVVATDGFRMALNKVSKEKVFKTEKKIIVSSKAINELISLKTKEQVKMYILEDANQILFEAGSIVLVGRLINGTYPEYERVIPHGTKTKVVADTQELLQNLRLAAVFARESAHIIKLEIKDGQMTILAQSSGIGKGELNMDIEQEGENNEVSFNNRFLIDFLKSTPNKRVQIEMNSSVEPVAFGFEKDESFIHVIMPVRVQ